MKNKLNFTMHLNLLVITLLLFSACESSSNKVKVGYLPMVSSLTHFIALENGYYEDEGLLIEGNPIKTSNLIAQDLVAGHIDVGIELSIVPLLKQIENASNTAIIFSTSNITSENGFDGILVRSDSPYTNMSDLSSKRVGVFPGTTAKKTLTDLFEKLYPTLDLPNFIELDPPLHIQSLENKDVDALFTYEPTLTLGIVKNNFKKIANSIYAMQYSPNPIGVAAVNKEWLTNNPKTAEAFFRAIDKSVLFIKNNPKEARLILAKATNLDSTAATVMNIMPLSLSTQIDKNNLKGYLIILQEIGEIKVVPDPENICIK